MGHNIIIMFCIIIYLFVFRKKQQMVNGTGLQDLLDHIGPIQASNSIFESEEHKQFSK